MSHHTENAYQVDQLVTARVGQVFPFGVFVRLPDGAQAYVRKRELTLVGNLDPRQVVSEGQEIEAVVVALAESGRNLELSVRQAKPDPWMKFQHQHREGDVVTGTVKALSPDGAFIQVIPGVDGFVPLREITAWDVEAPDQLLWVGDRVETVITHINPQTRKTQLSIRRRLKQQVRVIEFAQYLASSRQEEHYQEPVEGSLDSAKVQEHSGSPSLPKRILVVDDDRAVLDPLVEWLCRQGCEAESAESPTQALAHMEESSFDSVLVDIDLSGEDGVALIRQMRTLNPECPVAAVSIPEWVVERGRELDELGIAEVFVKPLDVDEIREGLVRIAQGETRGGYQCLTTSQPVQDSVVDSFRTLAREIRGRASLRSRIEAGLRELLAFTRAEAAMVFYMDPVSHEISIVAHTGVLLPNYEAVYSLGDSPVKDLIYERKDIFELHVSQEARPRFSKLLDLFAFESCIGVPIQVGEQVHHALFLFHRKPDAFARHRLRDAWAMATLFSAALENDLLEHRIRDIGRFLLSGELSAGFGHEIYNKISGLEIQIRNLQADYVRPPRVGGEVAPANSPTAAKIGKAIDGVLETTLDLKDVAVSFRDLTRAETKEEIDVNEIVRCAELLLRPTARKHRVHITTRLAPDLHITLGSAVGLQQVFSNVMLNAVQQVAQKMERFSDGWGMLEVTSSWEPEDTTCPIKVRFTDTGPGIHRQLWKSIFTLGFSTRPGGTGLGLFVARSIVESVGGRIGVEKSLVPLGTTFLVELPAVEVSDMRMKGND